MMRGLGRFDATVITYVAWAGSVFAASLAPAALAERFAPAQISKGAELYEVNCASCHGARMRNPEWAIDLATFPRDDPARFASSVSNGVRNMPAWADVLKPDDIQALWAYVVAGEKGN